MAPTNMEVYRRRADLGQAALGKRVGVSQPRISNIEGCNDESPPLDLLEKIKKVIKFPGAVEEILQPYVHGQYPD